MTWIDRVVGLAALVALILGAVMAFRARRWGLLLTSAGGLLLGATLQAQFGLWRVLLVVGIALGSFGVYLLVHRYRYGRWTP